MIHHLVIFDFHEGTSADTIENLRTRLRELPALIPEVVSYRVVDDLGLRDTNSALAVLAEFETREAFMTYVAHPAHQAVIDECITPNVSRRSALQYET